MAHQWTSGVEDFGTVGGIFIHDATVAEFLDETFLALNIGIRYIANFIRVEAVPRLTTTRDYHFVPTRALANGIIETGSIKLMNAYPTLTQSDIFVRVMGAILAFILKVDAKVQKIICPRIGNIDILHEHLLY
jgi:hypothetical protein